MHGICIESWEMRTKAEGKRLRQSVCHNQGLGFTKGKTHPDDFCEENNMIRFVLKKQTEQCGE